jgi:hypothetical protein
MLASATLFAQGAGQAGAAGAPPAAGQAQAGNIEVPWNDKIPPGTAAHATKALAESSRHGEWVDIALPGGGKLNSFVIYPERKDKTGVVGFCWGGTQSFNYAIAQPNLDAAVVYYGNPTGATADSAPEANLAKIKAPVLGLYGGNDARIDSTIPPTEAAMKKLGKFYEPHLFDGAGHGFMFSQAGANGANLKAAEQAWPLTIAFFQKHLK